MNRLVMIRSSGILGLLFALLALVQLPLPAQRFEEIDLSARIMAHPLFRQFDPETRRFLGTDSAFRSMASLSRELESVRRDLVGLRRQIALKITAIDRPTVTLDQEPFWSDTRDLRSRMERLQRREFDLVTNIGLGTWTPSISILPWVRQIARDVLPETVPGRIILDRLPEPDDRLVLGDRENTYLAWFVKADSVMLARHYEQRMQWWKTFPALSRSVLWTPTFPSPRGDE